MTNRLTLAALLAAATLGGVATPGVAQRRPRVAEVQLAPPSASLRVGERAPFVATAYDATGNPLDSVTFVWSSSDLAVVTVDQGGIATGVAVGLAIVTVRVGAGAEAKSGQAPVQVTAAAPAPVVTQAAPATASLPAGNAQHAPAAPVPTDRLDSLRRACDGGDALSCTNLGQLYESGGGGVSQDFGQARNLYQRGCDGGNAQSCVRLSSMYVDGRGVAPDTGRGVSLGLRACDLGNAEACMKVGWCFTYAFGVARDLGRGAGLAQRACDGGNALGCNLLGWDYETGSGVTQDPGRARTLYQRTCDMGEQTGCNNMRRLAPAAPAPAGGARTGRMDPDSLARVCEAGTNYFPCAILGTMYRGGTNGLPQNLERARSLLQRGCDHAMTLACDELGKMYEAGEGVGRDPGQARDLYRRGCEGRYPVACSNLAWLLYRAGDLPQAKEVSQRACDAGAMQGCVLLAQMFGNGEGGPADFGRAFELFQRACDRGAPNGCASLGIMYQRGLGVAADTARARTLYRRACDGGDRQACDLLRRMP